MKTCSLEKRLAFAVAFSQLLLAVGLVVVATSFSRHYGRRAFDVSLEGHAESIAARVYYPDDGSPGLLFNAAKVFPADHRGHGDLFSVVSDHGDFERHTAGLNPQIFANIPPGARFWNFHCNGQSYRAIVLRDVAILDTEEGIPQPLPKLTVIYAASTGGLDHAMRELAEIIGVVSLAVLIPTMVLAVWSIRKALMPLRDLALAAGAISVEHWNFEPPAAARGTEELQPLIGALSTVLTGLEAAFTRQREFVGDAAHELKTSLAILKSTLQMLIARPQESIDYVRGLTTMNRDCERLESLLNRMLQTARAEQRIAVGHRRQLGSVDLASSCESAIAKLAQCAADKKIRIDFSATGETMIHAEMADLELIWLNLLENAIQYGPYGSVVEVTCRVQSGLATVIVTDHGFGIEAEHLERIFERFYRADSSRARATGGFGLGLAIAKSLVTFYGGQIRAESSPGKGTRISVSFPLDRESSSLMEQQSP
jgi:signal transduction histidine kinase